MNGKKRKEFIKIARIGLQNFAGRDCINCHMPIDCSKAMEQDKILLYPVRFLQNDVDILTTFL